MFVQLVWERLLFKNMQQCWNEHVYPRSFVLAEPLSTSIKGLRYKHSTQKSFRHCCIRFDASVGQSLVKKLYTATAVKKRHCKSQMSYPRNNMNSLQRGRWRKKHYLPLDHAILLNYLKYWPRMRSLRENVRPRLCCTDRATARSIRTRPRFEIFP